MKYRKYQNDAAMACYRAWADGFRRLLVVMATGTGKSVTLLKIVEGWDIKLDGGVMILAHKRKLVDQLRQHCAHLNRQIGIEMGLESCRGDEDIVIGTVQSIARRLSKFNIEHFGLVIVDEAHHDSQKSLFYNEIEQWTRQKPTIYRLGFTATPQRGDGIGLSDRYDHIAFEFPLHKAIQEGWLVEPIPYVLGVKGLSFDRLRSDFSQDDIGALLTEDDKTLHNIAAQIIAFCGDKKFLVFMPTKASARRLRDILNDHPDNRHKCMEIDSDCHEEERHAFFEATKEGGPCRQLVGCDMLTEGYDCPDLEVVILVTKVGPKGKSALIQRVGRVTRPLSSVAAQFDSCSTADDRKLCIARSAKPFGIVVDMCGFSSRHNFIMPVTLEGEELSEEELREIGRIATEQGTKVPVKLDEIARQAKENLEKRKQLEAEEQRRRQELDSLVYARVQGLTVTKKNGLTNPDQGSYHGPKYKPAPEPATPAQVRFLKWKGVWEEGLTKKQAGVLIARLKQGPPTVDQIAILSKCEGYQGPPSNYFKADALIKLLKARGMRGPVPVLERWTVSVRQNKIDKKYRIYLVDSVTRKEIVYNNEAFILSHLAIYIARQISS